MAEAKPLPGLLLHEPHTSCAAEIRRAATVRHIKLTLQTFSDELEMSEYRAELFHIVWTFHNLLKAQFKRQINQMTQSLIAAQTQARKRQHVGYCKDPVMYAMKKVHVGTNLRVLGDGTYALKAAAKMYDHV